MQLYQGFTNWKEGTQCFQLHESRKYHKMAVEKIYAAHWLMREKIIGSYLMRFFLGRQTCVEFQGAMVKEI